MPRHSETKLLPYAPEQLFDLVADVARYDEFLPWVVAVRIRSSSEKETVADLVVGFNAFKERFSSRVVKNRPTDICVDYVEGPDSNISTMSGCLSALPTAAPTFISRSISPSNRGCLKPSQGRCLTGP